MVKKKRGVFDDADTDIDVDGEEDVGGEEELSPGYARWLRDNPEPPNPARPNYDNATTDAQRRRATEEWDRQVAAWEDWDRRRQQAEVDFG